MVKNMLILGNGGREHAFAWKLKQSKKCGQIYICPGNGGTELFGINVNLAPTDFEGIKSFVINHDISMVVVGPEQPLVDGIVDFFDQPDLAHVNIIGPSKQGAQLEGSKAFAKQFMQRHHIPTAKYFEVDQNNLQDGIQFLHTLNSPYVLKADGLAAGKGVLIIKDIVEAESELENMLSGKFGTASHKVVIEEFLDGIEFSVFVVTDGKEYLILPEAKDYKRIGVGDSGLNTGGMGAVSPVPFVDSELMKKVEEQIIKPTVKGLEKDQLNYKGFVFIGLIKVNNEPFVIEYNCRMGDPETEVVLPRLQNDLLDIFEKLMQGRLNEITIETNPNFATTIMLVSGGYPGDYGKHKVITFPSQESDSIIFHAGTIKKEQEILTNGGRVLAITSMDKDMKSALQKSLVLAQKIDFEEKYYRNDIGFDL